MLKRLHFPDLEPAPFTEPLIVPDIVITGAEIEAAGPHIVRVVGWTLTKTDKLDTPERRIVVRLSVPLDVAREIWADLADALREQGGYGDRRSEVLAAQFRDRRADN